MTGNAVGAGRDGVASVPMAAPFSRPGDNPVAQHQVTGGAWPATSWWSRSWCGSLASFRDGRVVISVF